VDSDAQSLKSLLLLQHNELLLEKIFSRQQCLRIRKLTKNRLSDETLRSEVKNLKILIKSQEKEMSKMRSTINRLKTGEGEEHRNLAAVMPLQLQVQMKNC
jgi:predicted RNase H-like nuclease (RuvC/YqgF family)